MGSLICIANDKFSVNPLSWKSKIIEKVATDIKSAETLSLESAVDNAVFLSSMLKELYSKQIKKTNLPIIINEDSKCLVESLYSTKKVQKKTMRLVISNLQQYLKTGVITEVNHVRSQDQLSDVLTKRGVLGDKIIHAVSNGTLIYPEENSSDSEKLRSHEKYCTSINDESSIHPTTQPENQQQETNQTKPMWKRIWRKFDNLF